MPSPSAGTKVIQVQLEHGKVDRLDNISNRTHVPRATLLRMAIDKFLEDAEAGRFAMGISVSPTGVGVTSGPQPTFAVVAPPPPPPETK